MDAHNERWFAATMPTPFTRFWRVFLPWQAWRFAVINLRMIFIIGRGHR
jgi:hypothetical protein